MNTISLANVYRVSTNQPFEPVFRQKAKYHLLGLASALTPTILYGSAALLVTSSIPIAIAAGISAPVKYAYDCFMGTANAEYTNVKISFDAF